MLNAYRDYEIYQGISIYGIIGVGIAKVKSSGWLGNVTRQYASNTDTSIAYPLGAGVSYEPINKALRDLHHFPNSPFTHFPFLGNAALRYTVKVMQHYQI